jgi:hypothetical protein
MQGINISNRATFIAEAALRLYSHLGSHRDNYGIIYSYTPLLSAQESVEQAVYLADALEKMGQAPWEEAK